MSPAETVWLYLVIAVGGIFGVSMLGYLFYTYPAHMALYAIIGLVIFVAARMMTEWSKKTERIAELEEKLKKKEKEGR